MRRPLFFVCLCLTAIAALRLWLCDSSGAAGWQEPMSEEILTVTGRVRQKGAQSFTMEVTAVHCDTNDNAYCDDSESSLNAAPQQNFPKKILCEYPQTSAVPRLGSTVTVRGSFQAFSGATNPGEFDRAAYYDTLGIGGELADVTLLACGKRYSRLEEGLCQLKCYFKERLASVFPEKEASVLTAMLLGDREELDSGVKDLYRRNGILHILSISGLHISVIGMGLYRLLRRMGLPVWASALCGGVVLGLYGVMTGMGVSARRAIGMYLIRMLAEVLGRTYDMLTALGVMAAVLTASNPAWLRHAGFLLSFGSVLGVGALYPALHAAGTKMAEYAGAPWLRIRGDRKGKSCSVLRSVLRSVLGGVCVTLFTLPVQLWFYYEVPVYSILLNLLVLPFVSAVMVSAMAALLLPGAGVLGTGACLILRGYELLCEWFDTLPCHTWNPGRPAAWQVAGYYALMLCVIFLANGRRSTGRAGGNNGSAGGAARDAGSGRRLFAIPCLLCAAVCLLTVRVRTEDRITFLDVGQGDGMLLETASGEVYLFDCGSSSRRGVGEYVLIPYLKYRGIQRIDAVFVSHPDEDHCNGVEELLTLGAEEGIAVDCLVLPDIAEQNRREAFAELLEAAQTANALPRRRAPAVSRIRTGDRFEKGRLSLLCLHPPKGYETGDANAGSECFYIELRGKSGKPAMTMLLTGDVEGEGERLLMEELERRKIGAITLLKVAHHGSGNSTPEELLARMEPKLAVISCGRNNRYGHPHAELLERLEAAEALIYNTSRDGAVTVRVTDRELRVERFLAGS